MAAVCVCTALLWPSAGCAAAAAVFTASPTTTARHSLSPPPLCVLCARLQPLWRVCRRTRALLHFLLRYVRCESGLDVKMQLQNAEVVVCAESVTILRSSRPARLTSMRAFHEDATRAAGLQVLHAVGAVLDLRTRWAIMDVSCWTGLKSDETVTRHAQRIKHVRACVNSEHGTRTSGQVLAARQRRRCRIGYACSHVLCSYTKMMSSKRSQQKRPAPGSVCRWQQYWVAEESERTHASALLAVHFTLVNT
jgi:hypothetical protein